MGEGDITIQEIDATQKSGPMGSALPGANTPWTLVVPPEDITRAIAFGGEKLKFLDAPDYQRFRVDTKTFDALLDALIVVADEHHKEAWVMTKKQRDVARAIADGKKAAAAK